ncbi:MAG: histidine phosphatase family protein [Candidatus Omnitrophica bacterium]|nr:histidine phosphatase family protein [Candidatus Omnitrophota bacterium]
MKQTRILRLYLLRHAIAVKRGAPGYPDDDRPLTREGIVKMKKAALGIRSLGEDFGLIITSPMQRASHTAEILAQALKKKPKVIFSKDLLPGAFPQKIAGLIARYKKQNSLVLVGHEPDFGIFASYILGGRGSAIELKKGGMCRIDIPFGKARGKGTLIWLLSPRYLCMLAGGQ